MHLPSDRGRRDSGHGVNPGIAIIGNAGGTNVGESLRRAAEATGHDVLFFNAMEASHAPRIVRALSWRLDRRPPLLSRFSDRVVADCKRARPQTVIATGAAPLRAKALRTLRDLGIACINYSTDDPWNPGMQADWYLKALPYYDVVFTTRQANLDDFHRLGCADVGYLPFAYDETLWSAAAPGKADSQHDILFVGGADCERVAFMTEFMRSGPAVALVGEYWHRWKRTRTYTLGQKPPEEVAALTVAAKVNLCLVRRANRDGHVMRSFEIAALGGCMLVEDTAEHREIFGPDGEAVTYFRTPEEAADRARFLLTDPAQRSRLAAAVQARITSKGHTYRDRLLAIMRAASGGLKGATSSQRGRLWL